MLQPIRQRITGSTDGSTAVDITLPQVKADQVWRITHLAFQNASGESVTLAFGLLDGSNFTQIWANQTVADSDGFGTQLNFLLLEGDKLSARVTGSAKTGKVIFSVSGELHSPGPGIIEVVQAPAPGAQNA